MLWYLLSDNTTTLLIRLLLEIKCVNGILIDFGFDEQNFLYILYKDEDSYGLIKTHKAYNFFSEHNQNLSVLDLLNCESFYNIKNIIFKDFDLLDSILMYDKEVCNNIKLPLAEGNWFPKNVSLNDTVPVIITNNLQNKYPINSTFDLSLDGQENDKKEMREKEEAVLTKLNITRD